VLRRPGWLAALLVSIASASLTLTASAVAVTSPEQEELVAAYAPHLMLREQTDDDNCDTTEEQYSPPTTVDTVLGNPTVKLVHYVGGKDVPIKKGPTAADVAGLGDDYYLDLPGDPLDVQCPKVGSYATDFKALRAANRAPAITYAHIATEPGYTGLVVQYFFFYYFNQFNDVHEGDWEGMQISFDADTPAEALARGPSQIALFQHAGGERADWDDTKVQKDGNHPIVYPAAGSHATFYDDAIYIQNGSHGSGVGCDNTSEPHAQSDPRPVIVPTAAAPGSEFQWLSFLGHWGQREKGFNNGPQGPTTKKQWLRPFTWMDGIRQDSPRLPGGAILGPAPATAFCGAIEGVSEFINLEAKTTLGAIGLALALLLLIVVPPLFTRWRPVDLSSLRHEWAFGQLVRGARQLYGRHWRIMLLIALSGFLILGAIQGLQYLFTQINGSQDFTVGVSPGGAEFKFNGSFGGIAHPIGFAFVSGAVVAFMRQLDQGEELGLVACYRAIYARLWRVVGGQLLATILVLLMIFTVIGIPFAIYFYIAWQFVQQEILFKDSSVRDALKGSHARVRGHWWRTILVTGFLFLIGVVTGPVLGFFLIFANLSAVLVNLIGSVVFALLIPYIAIGRTLLYFDLGARDADAEKAGEPRRRRLRLRPRPATGTS
jgi:Vacuolar protein sorting-associated protein 62